MGERAWWQVGGLGNFRGGGWESWESWDAMDGDGWTYVDGWVNGNETGGGAICDG